MGKVTRRFFLFGGTALIFIPWSWFRTTTAGPRRVLAGWWTRLHRWRTGMRPRWVEWSSTTFYRDGTRFVPCPHKVTGRWRELRWPDNDELVRSEALGVWSDDPRYSLEFLPNDGVEWNEPTPECRGETGSRLPGSKCKTGQELIDKVRSAAHEQLGGDLAFAGMAFAGDDGNELVFTDHGLWVLDAKATVKRWDGVLEPGHATAESKLMAALERDSLPLICSGNELEDSGRSVMGGSNLRVRHLGSFGA